MGGADGAQAAGPTTGSNSTTMRILPDKATQSFNHDTQLALLTPQQPPCCTIARFQDIFEAGPLNVHASGGDTRARAQRHPSHSAVPPARYPAATSDR